MCGTRSTFAQPQPKWYVGGRQVGERDLATVTGEQFRKIFPSEARGFSKEFSKIIPIADGRLYMIAFVNGNARPITRLVLYTESKTPSKCGAKCRNARGKSCDCSCKGQNHGVGASFSRTALSDRYPTLNRKAQRMKNTKKAKFAATIEGAANYTKMLVKSLGFYPDAIKLDKARNLLVLEFDSPLISAQAASKLSYAFATRGSGVHRVSMDEAAENRGGDVVGVVTIYLDDVAAKGLNARSGGKAAFATAGQVADMFKTLSDVERASIKGDTAKMQVLLKSLAPMVDRDRAKLPKDAVAYYDEMRRKAGMSRSGGKAKMGKPLRIGAEVSVDYKGETVRGHISSVITTDPVVYRVAIRSKNVIVKRSESEIKQHFPKQDWLGVPMSRVGGKAKYGAWREGGFDFKTRTLGEEQVQLLVNEGSGWMNAGVVADEQEARNASRGYVKTRNKGFVYIGGVWQKAKASRSGGKAKFLRFKVQIFHGGTLTGTLPAQEFMEYARKFVPNVSRSSFLQDAIEKFNEAAERANMNTRAELQVTKASRSGAKARFASWRKVHSEGWGDLSESWTATIGGRVWSIVVDASNPSKSHLMYRDSRGVPVHVKEGSVESLKRWAETAKLSRSGGKAKFAENANYARMDILYVMPDGSEEREMMSGSVWGAIASANKSAVRRGDGTKVYIKAHIPAGGRHRLPARVETVYKGEVKNGDLYERGGTFARSGGKAAFAKWEQEQTKKHGQPISEFTAKIGRDFWKIEVREAAGGNISASLYLWDDLRGYIAMGQSSRLQELQNRAESLSRNKEARAVSNIERIANYSRSGGKSKFAINTYDAAEQYIATIEDRIAQKRRQLDDRERWCGKANRLMSAADAGDAKAQTEVIGIARLLEAATRSGFARSGGKAKFAHWTESTRVVESLSYENIRTGQTVSGGGAVPWRTEGEKKEWKPVHYFVFMDTARGTTFGGRYSTQAQAQSALDKAKREHAAEVAKYETAPAIRKRMSEIEGELAGLENSPSAAGRIPRMDRLKEELNRLRGQLKSLGFSRTGEKAAFASANPIANKVAQLMSEGATRDQAVAFAADARKRGEL